MSIIYGVINGLLAMINWNADTVSKRLLVQLVVSFVSLAFGFLAGRGIQ